MTWWQLLVAFTVWAVLFVWLLTQEHGAPGTYVGILVAFVATLVTDAVVTTWQEHNDYDPWSR